MIDTGTLITQAGRVRSMAEYPDTALDRAVWRTLFKAAGFTVDGRPAERPAHTVELWRGSVSERKADRSSSVSRAVAVAEAYATGTGTGARRPTTGRLYRVLAPPRAPLARNNGRAEDEYVLDTETLPITEVPLTR
ncbi:hypothetical protein [Streptomyces sp. NPDC048623]|uniref:hypothetical protein n=1 Tax=Streptomyces sp. NPDC048623 TaxID=3155761 RepID=UPI00342618F5